MLPTDPLRSPNESFFYDEYLERAWHFQWLGIVLFFLGLSMAVFGIIGVPFTLYCEVSPKRRLEEQFARLRDHKLRDPICHLKGRMLGVKTQDWKDYFSMPSQMLTKKKEQKKLGIEESAKVPVQRTKGLT